MCCYTALFFKDQASEPPEHLPWTGRCWGHKDGHSAPSVQKLTAGGSTEPKDGSLNRSEEAMSSKWHTQRVRAGQRREGGSSLEGQGHHQGLPGGGVFSWASEDEKGLEVHFPGSPLCKGGMQRRERITATGETNCAHGGNIPYYQVGQ